MTSVLRPAMVWTGPQPAARIHNVLWAGVRRQRPRQRRGHRGFHPAVPLQTRPDLRRLLSAQLCLLQLPALGRLLHWTGNFLQQSRPKAQSTSVRIGAFHARSHQLGCSIFGVFSGNSDNNNRHSFSNFKINRSEINKNRK